MSWILLLWEHLITSWKQLIKNTSVLTAHTMSYLSVIQELKNIFFSQSEKARPITIFFFSKQHDEKIEFYLFFLFKLTLTSIIFIILTQDNFFFAQSFSLPLSYAADFYMMMVPHKVKYF